MATTDYLPSRESELVTWIGTFDGLISISATTYGLTTAQATAYSALASAYTDAYALANADATRTPVNIILKDEARRAVIENTRELAGIIQNFPGTTDAMRSSLGLTVPAEPSNIPVPGVAPGTHIISAVGRVMTVRIHDSASSTKRSKPAGCVAAWVYSYAGATYPTDPAQWEFQGACTKNVFEILFPDTVAPGTKVWVCAAWINAKQQSGPVSTPIGQNLPGGLSMAG